MAYTDQSPAGEILTRHLGNHVELTPAEIDVIDGLAGGQPRSIEARRDLILEGAPPRAVLMIVSGWACRYKTLEDGRRQIVALLVPGDMCDLHNDLLEKMDHSIGALTRVRYVELSNVALHRAAVDHVGLGQALWRQMLVNVAIQREWTMNIGQRSALERIGSLFCEILLRLRAMRLVDGRSFDFPLTQVDIAEATGLTSVHVNRTLQQMRAMNLITLSGRVLTIANFAALKEASLFSADYLHMDGKMQPNGTANLRGANK